MFSPNWPTGPIRSSSRDVRPYPAVFLYLVPVPFDYSCGLSLSLRPHDEILASHWSTTQGGPRGGGKKGLKSTLATAAATTVAATTKTKGGVKKMISAPLSTSALKKIFGPTIRIGQGIQCLPYGEL